jgi:hypothetical protein
MEIFWRLVLGHLIADFTLQTNYIAAWKRRNLFGLAVHCATHPFIYAILLWRYLDQVWVQVAGLNLTGWTCLFLIFATHFIEDEWRIWSVLKKGAPDNTFFYIWDQIIHYAVLFAFAPVVEGHSGKFGFIDYPTLQGVVPAVLAEGFSWWDRFTTVVRPEPWVFVAILLSLVTHFTTVTIYFLEKDLYGTEFPEVREKYVGMAERLVIFACFLLPGLWWISVVGIWVLRAVLYKTRKIENATWINLLVGNLAAVACGLLSRMFFYA